eukprot:TRINITY_DN13497_c0_g1_i1.p2 TRINITY_DN13497_c0_g1~~TRINITY_DN13497_c0_g1_i1.p2  ORF type:complete len:374 (+),score=106.06 TRINITY_DN13497_c0_g1_i1:1474-2595(+)
MPALASLPTVPAGVAAAVLGSLACAFARARLRRRAGRPPAAPSPPPVLRLPEAHEMAFNVGSLNMLTPSFEQSRFSEYVPAPCRTWEYRRGLLRQMLCGLGMDVIAVQEARIGSFEEDFGGYMGGQGYGSVAPYDKAAAKGKQGRRGDGLAKTAVFYRRAVFDLVWAKHRSRAVLCALRHRRSREVVFVVNVHLEGHPRKALERFRQLRSALECLRTAPTTVPALADLSRRPVEDLHVIVCGDLNSSQHCAPYQLLDTGALDPEFADPFNPGQVLTAAPFTHPFRLRDVYGAHCVPTYVARNAAPRTIDFVFASASLAVQATMAPVDGARLAEALKTKIPNAWHPSDHFPIGATVAFGGPTRGPADLPEAALA